MPNFGIFETAVKGVLLSFNPFYLKTCKGFKNSKYLKMPLKIPKLLVIHAKNILKIYDGLMLSLYMFDVNSYTKLCLLSSRVSFRRHHLLWWFGRCVYCCVDNFTGERFQVRDPEILVLKILISIWFDAKPFVNINIREEHILVKTNQQRESKIKTQQ